MPFCVAKSAELPVRELLEGVQAIVGSAVTTRQRLSLASAAQK